MCILLGVCGVGAGSALHLWSASAMYPLLSLYIPSMFLLFPLYLPSTFPLLSRYQRDTTHQQSYLWEIQITGEGISTHDNLAQPCSTLLNLAHPNPVSP